MPIQIYRKISPPKTVNFQIKKKTLIFYIFLLKTEAVLTSTHNLCLWAEIRENNVHPCKPQFYYIKVGFKGVKII